jgi:hypothetical protein
MLSIEPYSSKLTKSSPTFKPPDGSSAGYYYEAIQVNVFMSGMYTFLCNGTTGMHGHFYIGDFNRSASLVNRNATADDGGKGRIQPFNLSVSLQIGKKYILVVTTHNATVTASFMIHVSGPPNGLIDLTPITTTKTTTTTTTTTATTTTTTATTTTTTATTTTTTATTTTTTACK